ncbi:MAG TPA: biosynthetic-type acetolactate synthase large subunit [Bacteroidota bacterium]|nr:biosynthetic-type acetolactate synthase large subunit [Bacteroidota bacterium]
MESSANTHKKKPESSRGKLMTGSEIFVRSLIEEGVEVIFGYPGGAIIGVYDALVDLSDINHVLVRHEQGATHAAEGYAKATGKPGVALVTSGPGATNTVTGIADAYMDSIPIVVFSGQVPLKLIGNDAFQEADIVGITRPITKHNYLVRDVRELAKTIKEAFYVAKTGRPGPVLVDLPKDVMAQKTTFEYPESISMRSYNPAREGDPAQVSRAAALINASKRPVLYVGGGVIQSNAAQELFALAEKLGCPVTTTLHGLGSFPETNRLSMGMLGMHGTWYSNTAVDYCDLLIAVGARFDDRVTGKVEAFAAEAKKIHIDIDPSAISKNVKVDVPIVGDVRTVLNQLAGLVQPLDTNDWLATIDQWKSEHPLRYSHGNSLRAQYVIHEIGNATNGDAIVVTDVGQHQMWTAQFYTWVHPRSHITSGGLGTMGFSLPAAMGAAFGRKDLPVISISGDGGFQMNMQEMATIVEHKVPMKIFVINNGFLGMVRQWQELFWRRRYSHVELYNPDFVKLAEAFGCPGVRVTKVAEVEGAIRTAMEHTGGPFFVEFVVAKEDNVYPMIPAGQTVDEMLDTPEPVAGPQNGRIGERVIYLQKGEQSKGKEAHHVTSTSSS